MNNNSENGSGSNSRAADIMISLSVGLMAGVAATLLLAPASGRNTRHRIAGLASDVVKRTGRVARNAADAVEGQMDKVGQVVADGKQAYRQAREDRMREDRS